MPDEQPRHSTSTADIDTPLNVEKVGPKLRLLEEVVKEARKNRPTHPFLCKLRHSWNYLFWEHGKNSDGSPAGTRMRICARCKRRQFLGASLRWKYEYEWMDIDGRKDEEEFPTVEQMMEVVFPFWDWQKGKKG